MKFQIQKHNIYNMKAEQIHIALKQNQDNHKIQLGLLDDIKSDFSFIEKNIKLPSMFNKEGVFLVMVQIVISIFSLNMLFSVPSIFCLARFNSFLVILLYLVIFLKLLPINFSAKTEKCNCIG